MSSSSSTLSPAEEELREIEGRIKVVTTLWQDGHTLQSVQERHVRSKLDLQTSDQTARFIPQGGRMLESTTEMQALLNANEVMDLLLRMKNREPEHELLSLLRRRLALLERMLNI
jgi:hypothetical protein